MTGNANAVINFLIKEITENPGKEYECKELKRRRSLDMNSYFHVLCDKLRQKLGISIARCKNQLIADYGQEERLDGSQVVYKTNAPPEYVLEQEEPHMRLVKTAEENGKPVYFYRLYRGSRTYDSAEMAALIKGTAEECREQGIETLTPKELEEMGIRWGKKHGDKACGEKENGL